MRQAAPSQNKPSVLALFAKTANVTLFVATILIALLMLISFYSYHPHDPAWSSATVSSEVIHNYAGEQGAYFADIMFSAIGKTAWLIPFLLVGFGYQLFLKRQLLTVSLHVVTIRIIGSLLAIFALSALLDLHSGNGGMMGGFIGTELTNFLSVAFSMDNALLVYIAKIFFAILTLVGFYFITGRGPIGWADYCGFVALWLIQQIFPKKNSDTINDTVAPLPEAHISTDDSTDGPFKQEAIDRMLDQDERKAPTFFNKLFPQKEEETTAAYIELDEKLLQEDDYETNTPIQHQDNNSYRYNPVEREAQEDSEMSNNHNGNDKSTIPPIFRNLQRPNESTTQQGTKSEGTEHKTLDPFNRELEDWDQFIRTPHTESEDNTEAEVQPVEKKGIPSIFKNLFKARKRPVQTPAPVDSPIEPTLHLNDDNAVSEDRSITTNQVAPQSAAAMTATTQATHYTTAPAEEEPLVIEPSGLQFAIQDPNELKAPEETPELSQPEPLNISFADNDDYDDNEITGNFAEDVISPDITYHQNGQHQNTVSHDIAIDTTAPQPAAAPTDTATTIESSQTASATTGMVYNPQTGMMEAKQVLYPMAGKLPGLELLGNPPATGESYDPEELQELAELIESQFKHFNIEVKVVNTEPGPVITRFELDLAPGVKIAQINNLNKDIARALSVASVRIVEIIPGKPYIGLEIPNKNRQTVYFKEGLYADEYRNSHHPLTILLGKDVSGKQEVANLKDMPHLLIAGTTGSGKSVGINTILLSLLYKALPEDLRLILIDPKMLELSVYDGIPHLLAPVVTDMKESANALRWAVVEMERRYLLMSKLRVRNINGFNNEVKAAIAAGEPLDDPLWNPAHEVSDYAKAPKLEPLPYIVIVIDELADMMMSVGKAVEELIARLTQKARAAGIHLVVATQRPSVDVITGLIKANIPSRIAFQVSSKIDSRTILDQQGAENLLGQGDMLFFPTRAQFPIRVHGAFVTDDEVNRVTDFLRLTGAPNYVDDILKEPTEEIPGLSENAAGFTPSPDDIEDVLYDEAVKIVLEDQRPTISYVQRKLRIGYQRAARLIETMEEQGIVSAPANNGNREILVKYD
ncbi:hypothetical protein DC083_00555 [Ignatzschineria ureiclastica]|uniref:DNA translocase FtsK n=1 Tax=Ignatzschineria ureiclastica TaxID=472582 RepID=A0A2U2AGE9_9GAMM|nr:DNA translocase FtsK [Ignatzschineria ureiclastica]PWD81722.1 hypothetical protein DC083_00555 [Ignatzschineria ureiclastica]GGZ90103.1 hypothetical protein GCM10007162_01080 [Ignatzschineria ureiclastica]